MAADYLLNSLEVPALQVPTGYLDVEGATPTVWEAVVSDPDGFLGITNRDSTRSQKVARMGGGAYALLVGDTWQITVSGLTASIPKVEWMIEGPLPQSLEALFPLGAAYTGLSVVDGVPNYVWASRGGTITKVTSSLTPPGGGPWVYMGRLKMESGSLVGNHDRSGVPTLIGNQVWVRTADLGEPAWTPPAGIRYYHRTLGGDFLWDGTRFVALSRPWPMARTTIPAGEAVTIPAGYQTLLYGDIDFAGELVLAGELRILEG